MSKTPIAALCVLIEPKADKPRHDTHEVPEPPHVQQLLDEGGLVNGYDGCSLTVGGKAIGCCQQQGWRQE
jgi:hypothetical protein